MTKKQLFFVTLLLLAVITPNSALYHYFIQLKPTTGSDALLSIAKTSRFTEARLSRGFGYAELQRPSPKSDRGTSTNKDPFLTKNTSRGGSDSKRKSLYTATSLIYAELENPPTITQSYNLGILNIFEGRYTEAIDNLESILSRKEKTASVLNDLAVAYSERGEVQNRPSDLIHALSLVDEALTLDNSLLEAKFNCALFLEKINLTVQAKQYWQKYVALEPSLDWQKEAYQHISNLEQLSNHTSNSDPENLLVSAFESGDQKKISSTVVDFPHPARIYALEKVIPQWAALIQEKKEQDAIKLAERGKVIGELLSNLQQDKGVLDAIQTIEETSKDPKRRILLASAHLVYDAANKEFNKYENNKAKVLFEKAVVLFSQAKDEHSKAWAIFQIARCEMVLRKYQEAITNLRPIIKFAQETKNLHLLARSWWLLGLIQHYQVEYSKSLVSKRLALTYLEKAEDNEGISVVNALIASTLVNLQSLDEVWEYQYKALSTITKVPNPKRLFLINREVSDQLLDLKEVRAASYFYEELSLIADKENNQTHKFTVLLDSSRLHQKLSNKALADFYLKAAQQQLEKISDQDFYLRSKFLLLLTEAEYKVDSNPKAANEILNKLGELPKDDPIYEATVLRLQAKTYLSLKQYGKAEETIKTNIELLEKLRSKITDEGHRLSFFEESQAVYEDMIKFQINQKQRLDVAFDYAELARSRVLLDAIDGRAKAIKLDTRQDLQLEGMTKPFSLTEVQKALPSGVTLARYLVLPEKNYVWLVTKDKVRLIENEISEEELERQISKLRAVVTEAGSELETIQKASNLVYQSIFAKLKPYIKEEKTHKPMLIIIPDKALYGVPFVALMDPQTKQFLMEDYVLATAPSATIYLRCIKRDSQLTKQHKENILAIGNPTFTKADFPNMPYLTGAKDEAKAIAQLYPSSTLLLGKQATKEAFLKEITKHDVIHYAGHALVDPISPLFSKLLLATPEKPSDSNDGVLYAHEIYGNKFDKTRLVVLAACKTAGGLRTKGEGMLSLARPFLASGVPTVIASLWDANDKASIELFKEFHNQRLMGQNAASAMREAQLKLLKNPNKELAHPRIWALFQVIGGSMPN